MKEEVEEQRERRRERGAERSFESALYSETRARDVVKNWRRGSASKQEFFE